MKKSSAFFFMGFILLQLYAPAQGDYYLVQHYTNENGLPSNGIRGIEYDRSTGFLWVGTESGLVRFDGNYFKYYSQAIDSLNISRIFVLRQTEDGRIYVHDDRNSIYYIEGVKPVFAFNNILGNQSSLFSFRDVHTPAQQVADEVMKRKNLSMLPTDAVFENDEHTGNFLMLYRDSFFLKDIRKKAAVFLCRTMEGTRILKIGNSIYTRDVNNNFIKYNAAEQKMVPVVFSDRSKLPVPYTRNSNIGWWSRDVYWDPGMKDPLFVEGHNLWKLVEDKAGGLASGIVCTNCIPEDKRIDYIKVYDELHYIFIGSAVNGLYVLKQNAFHAPHELTVTNESETLPQTSQAELQPGYIMSRSGQAYSLQLKKLPGAAGINNMETAYKSSKGDVWYGKNNNDSLFQYKRVSASVTSRYLGDSTYDIVFAETKGRLFAISQYNITEVKDNSLQTIFRLPPPHRRTPGNYFQAFNAIEWEPGKIGIATYGIVVYDIERGLSDTIHLPHTNGEVVRALWKYNDYIFIGTYGQGFFIYKKGIIKKMPLDKNGYLSYTHCFMADDKGYCWMSTNNGLFKASLAALTDAFEKDDNEVYYHYFGKSDGMINTEFNGGCQPCALAVSDGSFSFPGMNGFFKFQPDSVFAKPTAGKIYINEITVDSLSVHTGSGLLNELPYTMNKLSITLSVPAWTNRENLYVSYQLSPRINEWQTMDIVNNNVLSFAGLAPGNYTLKLRVRSGYQPGEFTLASVHFTIATPWYNSRWFYFICFLIFLSLTLFVLRWRTVELVRRKKELQRMVIMQTKEITVKTEEIQSQNDQLQSNLNQLQEQQTKLEANNEVNARLISIITHDMISPLKFMGFIAENIKEENITTEAKNRRADSIINVSRDLESLSGKMLDWIKFHHHSYEMKPTTFNLYALVEEANRIALTFAKEKKISFYNHVDKGIEITQYREAIGEIMNNLAMNAIKNTDEGEICITHEYMNDRHLLTIRDTGRGMSTELVNKLNDQEQMPSDYSEGDGKKYRFGHLIIKDLLQLVNGKLTVESRLGEGTRITIAFEEQYV